MNMKLVNVLLVVLIVGVSLDVALRGIEFWQQIEVANRLEAASQEQQQRAQQRAAELAAAQVDAESAAAMAKRCAQVKSALQAKLKDVELNAWNSFQNRIAGDIVSVTDSHLEMRSTAAPVKPMNKAAFDDFVLGAQTLTVLWQDVSGAPGATWRLTERNGDVIAHLEPDGKMQVTASLVRSE